MTEYERLAKNNRIREQGRLTREKRKHQICRVYRVKIDISHLTQAQRVHMKMLFVEAKRLCNNALTFTHEHDINDCDTAAHTVRFYDINHIGIQGFRERIRIKGASQFWNIPGIELANAKLLNLSDGYYLAVTTYCVKGGEKRKYKVLIGESERIKKCQRLTARRKKGSNNRCKARKLLRRAYKKDTSNKIVHELLDHERVYMQDENLKGWHKGLFGRVVQHSVLGRVKMKLITGIYMRRVT